MDNAVYYAYLQEKEQEFEAVCKRCGECCGANDDPCRNLLKQEDGSYACRVYENRFGAQKTVSGKVFNCVPIREHIAKGTLLPNCAYRAL